jgi:pterin-4a-carbinolamine dehydratase
MQVKEFNMQASQMSGGVVIIGISQDLPFAQKRFCNSNNIDKMITLSDYRTNSFGINYGLLIKGLHLLARAVIIIDKANTIRYVQVAKELTNALNYEAALNALKEVIQNPSSYTPEELPSHCTPCQAGLPPLSKNSLEHLLSGIKGWELIEDKKIKKEFRFKDLIDAKYFVDLISIVAEEQGHHPNINLIYNKVIITLTTHSIGGLSNNDFLMAHIIDELGTQKEEEDAGI